MTLASILAVLVWLPFAVGASGDPSYVVVRGTVSSTSQPSIANAKVVAYSDVGIAETHTDASGRFTFLNLLPGVYHFYALKPGYSECALNRTDVEVSAGQEYDAQIVFTPCK